MANYILTNKAVEDLSQIWNYTVEVWSEAQADKYYQLFLHSFQELAKRKIKGKKYTEIPNDIFGFKAGQHIIFYKIVEDKTMLIVRILHSGMDLGRRIRD